MKATIKYIELKSGFSEDGPAWIGQVEFSKTRSTLYFNGLALKKIAGGGIMGNYYDLETGEEYWISGVKKDGSDRLKTGREKTLIDSRIVNEYLRIIGNKQLDLKKFDLIHVKPTDKKVFEQLENS